MYKKEQLEKTLEKMTQKTYMMSISTILSMINKLEEKQIEDDEIANMLDELVNAFNAYFDGDHGARKTINKADAKVREYVKEKYNLVQKGTIQGTYLAIFMGFGIALGAGLMSINTGMMGAGIAIGAGLGVAVGASLEKKADEEGRLY